MADLTLNYFVFWTIRWLDRWAPVRETATQISVTDAKAQLTELVRRAESGDEIVLTRHGHAAVRLVAVRPMPGRASRHALLDSVRASARVRCASGPGAERSQDFLYDGDGLPD